ncbi:hypothetical protein IGS59_21765 [Janthinobacterium sp. GW460P]|uniref:hypothetical protein n=1 Tax=unclassified Janthinobacterium TaxID=2610881 RepID=UPI00111BFCA1|nr:MULTISPECIES: hypothetical protein [unclassified Janthinobacterium]MCC7704874.1 hypothetical protein [Janthinobacterium sp. GW460P]MCC7710511.1 hypothetical protein [Janthinobacterium sp. GW460W]
MKTNSISNISLIILSALTVVGCNKTVDFRNIEISNNLIYERGENKAFTGKITNMPLRNMPVQKIIKITDLINNVSSNKSLAEILAVNSLEAMTGNGYGRIVCDTISDGGLLDGATTCKIPSLGTPLFSFTFKKNSLDGKVTIYDVKHDGRIVAEAEYKDGDINGPSKFSLIATAN